jgi:hypothetical protein
MSFTGPGVNLYKNDTSLFIPTDEKVNFFKSVRNVLILSSFGEGESEAFKMSGGDYDGDTALVVWDSLLLNVLQQTIEAEEGLADLVACEAKRLPHPLERKLVWKQHNMQWIWNDRLIFDELLRYLTVFESQGTKMGEADNLLTRAVDKWGFNDSRTCEISRRAFFQVDAPYISYEWKLKKCDKTELEVRPHWMERSEFAVQSSTTKLESYQSKRVLGWIYDYVEVEKNRCKIEVHVPLSIQCLDPRVADALKPLEPCPALREKLQAKMEIGIQEFLQAYKNRLCSDSFMQGMRQHLIETGCSTLGSIVTDQNIVNAAVLYSCCIVSEAQHKESQAVHFVWRIAKDELCRIFARRPSYLSDACLPSFLLGKKK